MTAPSNQDPHELAAAYALDAIDGEEQASFEAHLAECQDCQVTVAEYRETAAAGLGVSISEPPPAAVRSAVLDRIGETPQLPIELDSRRPRWITPALAAAAVAIIAAVGGLLLLAGDNTLSVEDLAASPDAETADLDGLTPASTGTVRVVWSAEDGKAAVVGDGLSDPGEGQIYALWAVIGDDVAPAGLFSVSDGAVEQIFDVIGPAPDRWGVTIEPAGGSPQPTGEILYLGSL